MRALLPVSICITLLSAAYGEDRPTLDSLVGEQIQIETGWTGYAFTLKKADGKYTISWKEFGSGVPVVRTAEFDVKVKSDYQFQFQLKRETKVNEILVSLGDRGEFKVYSDGMRIYAEKSPIP
jgi:hypothetical protein